MFNKRITNKRIMEAIYNELNDEDVKKNVFETKELNEKYDSFYDEYIKPLYPMDFDKASDAFFKFNNTVWEYNRKGFEAGFQAAMELLTHKSINKGGDVA